MNNMRTIFLWMLAAMIALAASCARAPQVLSGQVFLQRADGQAVKLALARVYFLRDEDLSQMQAAEAAKRNELKAGLEFAEQQNKAAGQAYEAMRKKQEAYVAEQHKLTEDAEARGVSFGALLSFQQAELAAQKAELEAERPLLDEMIEAGKRWRKVRDQANAQVYETGTTPARPVAVAAMTDADGTFAAPIPEGSTAVLVEVEPRTAEGQRVCWVLALSGLDLKKPVLFSDHNVKPWPRD